MILMWTDNLTSVRVDNVTQVRVDNTIYYVKGKKKKHLLRKGRQHDMDDDRQYQ